MFLSQSKHSQIASATERIFSTSFFQNKQNQPPPRQFLLPFMSFILVMDYVVQNSKPNYISLPYTQTSSWEQESRPILRDLAGIKVTIYQPYLFKCRKNPIKIYTPFIFDESKLWKQARLLACVLYSTCPPTPSYHDFYIEVNNCSWK